MHTWISRAPTDSAVRTCAANATAGVFDAQYDWTMNVNTAVNRQAAVIGMFLPGQLAARLLVPARLHGSSRQCAERQLRTRRRRQRCAPCEGQDFSGTDNANMATPADGGRPRMQMYIFSAGGLLNPTREGTFDMLIVGHEMGHYVSNRLIGNASGLSNNQGTLDGRGWAISTASSRRRSTRTT